MFFSVYSALFTYYILFRQPLFLLSVFESIVWTFHRTLPSSHSKETYAAGRCISTLVCRFSVEVCILKIVFCASCSLSSSVALCCCGWPTVLLGVCVCLLVCFCLVGWLVLFVSLFTFLFFFPVLFSPEVLNSAEVFVDFSHRCYCWCLFAVCLGACFFFGLPIRCCFDCCCDDNDDDEKEDEKNKGEKDLLLLSSSSSSFL